MTGRPVARLVSPLIVKIAVLVGLMATIAVTGVVLSTRSVEHLSDELEPAAVANHEVLEDLMLMEAGTSAWARSGQPRFRTAYERARTRLAQHEQEVRRYARGDGELAAPVRRHEEASAAWIEGYAEPRMKAPGGPGTFVPERFARGTKLFAEIRAAHDTTEEAFDERVRQARQAAVDRLKGTIVAVLLLTIAGIVVVVQARRRLMSELSDPLRDLEHVVQRLAHDDHDVRAEPTGPQEVRAIAAALNELADAQGLARAVEGRIHDELWTLETAKDDFVSNVSHELRTPLTTISGYLEMAAEEFEGNLEPHHERMLVAIRRNVARLRLLIDDLLTLSRAEARATDTEAVNLVDLVGDAVTDVRITASGRGIRITTTASGEPLLVLADRAMLHRAFLNVLSNAVKFSRAGGVVEVGLRVYGDEVEVTVRDHGIGIPAAELERLGTRFFRASNAVSNEIAGTGLGLRIVQTIVDKHAGEVVIDSREGDGTTVAVRLPRQGFPDGLPGVADLAAGSGSRRPQGAEGDPATERTP
jgi:signal transduction histidine kinase